MFQRPNERLSWVPVSKSSRNSTEAATQLCDFCNQEFAEAELPVHQRISHKVEIKIQILKNRDSFCGTCTKNFSSKEELIKHTVTTHLYSSEEAQRIEHEIFACDHCQQIFFTKLALQNHILFTHMVKNAYKAKQLIKCHYCKKAIPMCYYWVHTSKHAHLNNLIHCFKCDSKLKNLATFKEHLRSHPKHYYCDICRYSCDKELTFSLHVKSHRNSVTVPSNEENIERYYISQYVSDLWKMRKSVFFSGVWLPMDINVCVLCREICYSELEMRRHIQSHRPVDPKKVYTCECGETFSSKILLKQHKFQLKGSHTKDTPENKEPSQINQQPTQDILENDTYTLKSETDDVESDRIIDLKDEDGFVNSQNIDDNVLITESSLDDRVAVYVFSEDID